MKSLLAASLALLFAAPVNADDAMVRLTDVLSVATGYTDAGSYKAFLVRGTDGADLHIYDRDGWDLVHAAFVPEIAWTGIGGEDAFLSLGPKGSLKVHSANSGIGRTRWETTLTIARRDGQYLVGGYTHSWYDTISIGPDGDPLSGSCDLNLFTGKGERDGKPVRTKMTARPVTGWSAGGDTPEECQWD